MVSSCGFDNDDWFGNVWRICLLRGWRGLRGSARLGFNESLSRTEGVEPQLCKYFYFKNTRIVDINRGGPYLFAHFSSNSWLILQHHILRLISHRARGDYCTLLFRYISPYLCSRLWRWIASQKRLMSSKWSTAKPTRTTRTMILPNKIKWYKLLEGKVRHLKACFLLIGVLALDLMKSCKRRSCGRHAILRVNFGV